MSDFKTKLASISPDQQGEFLAKLPAALAAKSQSEQLLKLLIDFDFIKAKISAFPPQQLIDDYKFALHPNFPLDADQKHCLRLIQAAIRLSAHIINEDKTQLPAQLLGRLQSFPVPEIQAMLEVAKHECDSPWLRPLTASLVSPGGVLLRTFTGHISAVNAVAITPDGRRFVSGSSDRTLKVWDLQTEQEVFTLSGHVNSVESIAITPDGKKVISGSWDSTLKVWDLQTGEELFTLNDDTGGIQFISITPNGKRVISGSWGKIRKVWNLETGEEVFTFAVSTGMKNEAIAFTPDSKHLIFGTDEKNIKICDLETGEELLSFGDDRGFRAVAAISNNRVISVSWNNTRIWDLETGKALVTHATHRDWIAAVTFTPNGKKIISGPYEGLGKSSFKVWDIQTGEELFRLTGYTQYTNHPLYLVVVTPDSKKAIANATERTLKVWDLETGQELINLIGHTDSISSAALHPNSKLVISASRDNTLKLWNLEPKEQLSIPAIYSSPVTMLVITPDGKRVISGLRDNTIKVWDLSTKQEISTFTRHKNKFVNAMAIAPDGKQIISGSANKNFKLWKIETGEELLSFVANSIWLDPVTFTPDGNRIIYGSHGDIKIWDLRTGKQIFTLSGHMTAVTAIAITPDGKRMVSASGSSPYVGPEDCLDGDNHTLKVWDLESRKELFTFTGDPRKVNAVAITPDGKRVIYGTDHQNNINLKIWNLETRKPPISLSGHSKKVNDLAISPNGNFMVSVADDTTLKVWNLSSLEVIATFTAEDGLESCAVAPDGVTIVAGERSGRLHFLRLEGLTQPEF
ncbi:WD40 repeat domain-containing protein [Aerosakkonema sp. BLCC-F183]|uniref:WD40 repeat domain-containing protein n=1 Tax=Aerosakkonema sp. BLCC-F183 TaxID=3342834 RepID=UPI0035B7F1A1